MTIIERIQSPTPSFFKKIRNFALIMAALSGTILAAPVVLPAIVVQVAGYLAVGAAVASAVSQAVTNEKAVKRKNGNQ